MSHKSKKYGISALLLTLSGCSGLSGEWPNLAEPYPDPTQRERVIERANPVEPTVVADESPITRSGAFKLLTATRARIDNERTTYLSAKAKIGENTGEDRIDLWNEAQLSLTRLSQTLSRLDAILVIERFRDLPVWKNTAELKESTDQFLVLERRKLSALRPQQPSQ